MKTIDISSCDTCIFEFEDTVGLLCCDLLKLKTEDVPPGTVHDECPLRKGPVCFQLSVEQHKESDVAVSKKCRDCGETFVITRGELDFLARRFGPSFGEPTRCKDCRRARKMQETS